MGRRLSRGENDEWVQPDWWGPPDGWVGGVLPFDLVVAQSDAGAILAEDITVYPTGIGFELRALLRPEPIVVPEPTLSVESPATEEIEAAELSIGEVDAPADFEREVMPTDRVCLAIEFEDGRRAERNDPVGGPGDFTILAFQEGRPVHPDPAVNVVLNWSSGGGSPDSLRESSFIWPLPTGSLRFMGSWVDAGLLEQSVLIDHAVIEEALGRAHPGWRD